MLKKSFIKLSLKNYFYIYSFELIVLFILKSTFFGIENANIPIFLDKHFFIDADEMKTIKQIQCDLCKNSMAFIIMVT